MPRQSSLTSRTCCRRRGDTQVLRSWLLGYSVLIRKRDTYTVKALAKLAAVLAGHASDKLLDSYEAERIGFARRLVATTDRAFTFATAEGRIADILRTRVVTILFPKAIAFEAVRESIFRAVSQITLAGWCARHDRGVTCL